MYLPNGQPFEGDPRYVLKSAIEEAKKMGYSMNVGPEMEFFLFKLDANGNPTTELTDHDIYSIEDLVQLIRSLKEATEWKKPVFVKIAAVHNVAPIAAGIARSSADAVVIDGFRGGTGAAPKVFRDNVGIPIEVAIASVDQKLREQGVRNEISIIASGGIRTSADLAKSIALGADAVNIGTAALVALGCRVCGNCYRNLCPWGIATQRPDLVSRLDPEIGAVQVSNLIKGWTYELSELMGAAGINSIESLRGNRDRLRGYMLDEQMLKILDVLPAGA